MARAEGNKTYRTFVKGLITEASPLTYPEDSSYSELNTILSRKGSRTRRLGQTYGTSPVLPDLEVTDSAFAHNETVWKAVSNKENLNFLVVQKARMIHFFNMEADDIYDSKKPFTIDLSTYLRPNASASDTDLEFCQMAAGKGILFIVNDKIEPLYVEYDPVLDTISVKTITLLVRDFDGLNDYLANDEEPAQLSKEHHYNLMNQGWLYGTTSTVTFSTTPYTPSGYDAYTWDPQSVYNNRFYLQEGEIFLGPTSTSYQQSSPTDSPIFKFYQKFNRYPGNNKQWWVARAEADDPDKSIKAGDFLPEILNNLFSGNNKAPNGHYILNAFRKDRSGVSGISSIPIETIDGRPNAITFFSGRAWYGQGSTVYFSQILDSTKGYKAGFCYQEADPTAEDISELIASDGGVIPIPEADKIVRMLPLANGVVVFAMNGVWFVSGGDSGFTATSLSVSKISSVGTKSPFSILETGDTVFWWSEIGIQALQQASGQFGPIPGKFGNTNISEQTIQTLFNEIPEANKLYVKTCYDTRNNRIIWLYDDRFGVPWAYNKALIFDLTLQAFFLWEFSYIEDGPIVNGLFLDTGYARLGALEDVLVGVDDVETIALEQVVVSTNASIGKPSNIYYIVNAPGQGSVLTQTNDPECIDWEDFDGTGSDYDSYVETGFELMEDTMRKKQITYLFAHFRQMENSSCKLTTKWNWSNHAHTNKWSTEYEAYRNRYVPIDDNENQGWYVVTTKSKVRGNGKAIQFRFGTGERGKNFDLLGWSISFSGNTKP